MARSGRFRLAVPLSDFDVIFDDDTSFGVFLAYGSNHPDEGCPDTRETLVPDVTKQVWLKVVDKRGKDPAVNCFFSSARSPSE